MAAINPAILERLLAENLIPVVSTIGVDPAARPTTSTPTAWPGRWPPPSGAEKVIYLTDVAGLLRDVDDPDSLITRISAPELRVAHRATAPSPAA